MTIMKRDWVIIAKSRIRLDTRCVFVIVGEIVKAEVMSWRVRARVCVNRTAVMKCLLTTPVSEELHAHTLRL